MADIIGSEIELKQFDLASQFDEWKDDKIFTYLTIIPAFNQGNFKIVVYYIEKNPFVCL